MQNLSSLSKAFLAIRVSLALAAAGGLLCAALGWWAGTAVAVMLMVPAAIGFHFLRRANISIEKAIAVCSSAAQGQLGVRILDIQGLGNIGQMLRNINRLLDLCEAFCREAQAAMEMANRRQYFRKILTTGLRGDFARYAETINHSLDLMGERDAQSLSFAENKVRKAVQDVFATVTQLQSSSQRLNDSASGTVERAMTSAAASEEASVNVQTVAAAAEELSASFGEINRQTAIASTISVEAVDLAQRTNATVARLDSAAGEIGNVLGLIQDIAAKTNLLALNATIECQPDPRSLAGYGGRHPHHRRNRGPHPRDVHRGRRRRRGTACGDRRDFAQRRRGGGGNRLGLGHGRPHP